MYWWYVFNFLDPDPYSKNGRRIRNSDLIKSINVLQVTTAPGAATITAAHLPQL